MAQSVSALEAKLGCTFRIFIIEFIKNTIIKKDLKKKYLCILMNKKTQSAHKQPYFHNTEFEKFDEDLFKKIWALRPKEDQVVKFMGKEITLPRRIKAFGYDYSGYMGSDKNECEFELPEVLENLRDELGLLPYNSILINFYEKPSDYIGKHHDSDKQLNEKYMIYTFSIFEKSDDYRILKFTNPKDKTDTKEFKLTDFSLVGFNRKANQKYKHEVLKVKKSNKNPGKRISITFRELKED